MDVKAGIALFTVLMASVTDVRVCFYFLYFFLLKSMSENMDIGHGDFRITHHFDVCVIILINKSAFYIRRDECERNKSSLCFYMVCLYLMHSIH